MGGDFGGGGSRGSRAVALEGAGGGLAVAPPRRALGDGRTHVGPGGCGPGSRAPGSPSGGPGRRGRARVPASDRGDLPPPSCRGPGAWPGGTSWGPREHPLLPGPHPGCPQHGAGCSLHSWAVFCGPPDTALGPSRPSGPADRGLLGPRGPVSALPTTTSDQVCALLALLLVSPREQWKRHPRENVHRGSRRVSQGGDSLGPLMGETHTCPVTPGVSHSHGKERDLLDVDRPWTHGARRGTLDTGWLPEAPLHPCRSDVPPALVPAHQQLHSSTGPPACHLPWLQTPHLPDEQTAAHSSLEGAGIAAQANVCNHHVSLPPLDSCLQEALPDPLLPHQDQRSALGCPAEPCRQ